MTDWANKELLTDDEISVIAKGLYSREMLASWEVDPNLHMSVFMPIMFDTTLDIAEMNKHGWSVIIGYVSSTIGRSINGYPFCDKIRFINVKDAPKVHNKVLEIQKMMDSI